MIDDADTDQIRPPTKRGIVLDLMRSFDFPLERLPVPGKCSATLRPPAQRSNAGREDMSCRLQSFYRIRGEEFCRRHAASEVFSFLTGDEGA